MDTSYSSFTSVSEVQFSVREPPEWSSFSHARRHPRTLARHVYASSQLPTPISPMKSKMELQSSRINAFSLPKTLPCTGDNTPFGHYTDNSAKTEKASILPSFRCRDPTPYEVSTSLEAEFEAVVCNDGMPFVNFCDALAKMPDGPPDASTTRLLSCHGSEGHADARTRGDVTQIFDSAVCATPTCVKHSTLEESLSEPPSPHTPLSNIIAICSVAATPIHTSIPMTPQKSTRRSLTRQGTPSTHQRAFSVYNLSSESHLHGPSSGDYLPPNRNPYSFYRGYTANFNMTLYANLDTENFNVEDLDKETETTMMLAHAFIVMYAQTVPPLEAGQKYISAQPGSSLLVNGTSGAVCLFNQPQQDNDMDDDAMSKLSKSASHAIESLSIIHPEFEERTTTAEGSNVNTSSAHPTLSLNTSAASPFRDEESSGLLRDRNVSLPLNYSNHDSCNFNNSSDSHRSHHSYVTQRKCGMSQVPHVELRPLLLGGSSCDASPSPLRRTASFIDFRFESGGGSAQPQKNTQTHSILNSVPRWSSQPLTPYADCLTGVAHSEPQGARHTRAGVERMQAAVKRSDTRPFDSPNVRQPLSLSGTPLLHFCETNGDLPPFMDVDEDEVDEDGVLETGSRFRNHHRYQFLHFLPWRKEYSFVPINLDSNGVVWLATYRADGQVYNVKEIPGSKKESLQTELECLTLGNDPTTPLQQQAQDCIARYYTVSKHSVSTHNQSAESVVFMLQTEYFPRGNVLEWTLDPHLLRGSEYTVPEERFWRGFMQNTLHALESIHSIQIVHGNPLPFNVFIYALNHYKLDNFGSAVKSPSSYPFVAMADFLYPMECVKSSSASDGGVTEIHSHRASSSWSPYNVDVYVFARGIQWLLYHSIRRRETFAVNAEAKTHYCEVNLTMNKHTFVSHEMFQASRASGYHNLSDDLWNSLNALLHAQPIETVLKMLNIPSRSVWAARVLLDAELQHLLQRREVLKERLHSRQKKKQHQGNAKTNQTDSNARSGVRVSPMLSLLRDVSPDFAVLGRRRPSNHLVSLSGSFSDPIHPNGSLKANGNALTVPSNQCSPHGRLRLQHGLDASSHSLSLPLSLHSKYSGKDISGKKSPMRAPDQIDTNEVSNAETEYVGVSAAMRNYMEGKIHSVDARRMDDNMLWTVKEVSRVMNWAHVPRDITTARCIRSHGRSPNRWKPLTSNE